MNTMGLTATTVRGPVPCPNVTRTHTNRASVRTPIIVTKAGSVPVTHRTILTRQQLRSHSGIAIPRARSGNNLRLRFSEGARCNAKGVVAASATDMSNLAIYTESFEIGPASMIEVTLTETEMIFSTDLPGQLLLHWGVEQAGKEGWGFPARDQWPEATVQYKDRALQTPFIQADGYTWVRLPRPDIPGAIGFNFVVKDVTTNSWFNRNATNWNLKLVNDVSAVTPVPAAPVPPPPAVAPPTPAKPPATPPATNGNGAAVKGSTLLERIQAQLPPVPKSAPPAVPAAAPPAVPKAAPPAVPKAAPPAVPKAAPSPPPQSPVKQAAPASQVSVPRDLQNLWAYRLWEVAGRPNRNAVEQETEFQAGCRLIEGFLTRGYTLGELTKSAESQDFPPAEYPAGVSRENVVVKEIATPVAGANKAPPAAKAAPAAAPAPPQKQAVRIPKLPEEAPGLCALKAYMMWEKSGKPERSREDEDHEYKKGIAELNRELQAGKTVQQLEAELKGGDSGPGQVSSWSPSPQPQGAHSQAQGEHVQRSGYDIKSWVSEAEEFVGNEHADQAVVDRILVAENDWDMWTLMHRCNLCRELMDQVVGMEHSARIATLRVMYCWMRYSATRALTWQRSFNTQPRQLTGAQDGLSQCLASAHHKAKSAEERWYIRGMLGCSGRGGNGQAIRDDILHIMHRHHIKEQHGTWMEQWHQKLHNNTTPDDVVICEAYLAFLRSNGDNGAFWQQIHNGGIDRERLAGFARPITTEPQDYPHCRGGLIKDFEDYLKVLKSVHAGTDLGVAVDAAGGSIPGDARGAVDSARRNRGHPPSALQAAVEARTKLHHASVGHRELLYLDLALEDVVRAAAEQLVPLVNDCQGASDLFLPLLENLCLSAPANAELCQCLMDWRKLPGEWWTNKQGALRAVAVVDRVRRALGSLSDTLTGNLQHAAEALGTSLKEVDDWKVNLFSEEVVRGSAAFSVSLLCTRMDPALRQVAEMGAWQIISPGRSPVTGNVVVVPDLRDVQLEVYPPDTVMISNNVGGDEECPEGVAVLITPNAPDVLSHVSVRARNCNVLFATCYDAATLEDWRQQENKLVTVELSSAGDVSYTMAAAGAEGNGAGPAADAPTRTKGAVLMKRPDWCGQYAVGMDGFAPGVVGAKSKNLAGLRGKLPEWIQLPPSFAVPFSSFEEVLKLPANSAVKAEIDTAYAAVDSDLNGQLALCAAAVMKLESPPTLEGALKAEALASGVPWADDAQHWADAFTALKKVWASQYNERAFLSLRKAGLPHAQLCMAVLVQRVVPADYAFVIHTDNPSTGNKDEIYIEMVRGLGETLVGNYPGRALSCVVPKSNLAAPVIGSFPSKSVGLFVDETLIFRSDSNGEDLDGYAGAGLYDSIPMNEWREEAVSHDSDPLMADGELQRQVLEAIAKVGKAVEDALGSAQDVEGAVEMTPQGPRITLVQTRPQM